MSECRRLKNGVLQWVDSVKLPESLCRYKFAAETDDTIFCTCFALFILDLFKAVESFTAEEREAWVAHIQSFQNEQTGLFEPAVYYHKDKERNCYQLTCFCLSALEILGAAPRLPLKFIERWETPDDVKRYLHDNGCHKGLAGSGNKAMFLAIFLSHEYERTSEPELFAKLQAWFDFHNEAQNRHGLWGKNPASHYVHGLQNGLHQLIVYFYWQKEISKLEKIVDVALASQDKDGFFAPTPGGEACHDYDTIHILATAHNIIDYRKAEIETALHRAFDAILTNQNADGGFCQSKQGPNNLIDLMKLIPFYFHGTTPYLWYYRLRKCVYAATRKNKTIDTGWTAKGRRWDESNLWDTWFRCLSLAEIARTVDLENNLGLNKTNFHKTIGLGFFIK